ncbi:Oxalate:formate antiporter [Nymphon striatum]|nr:Oxalate:formate antiporter [Nymphon striatum]
MVETSYKPVLTICGSFLIMTTLGSLYSWGNMTTYVTSYMRVHLAPDITYEDTVWVLSAGALGLPVFMTASGYCVQCCGLKITLFLSCLLMCAFQILLRFMLDVSVVAFILVFMASYASAGVAYMAALLCSIRWVPENKGLVSGLIVGGFGLGSLVFTPVQSAFINPNNLSPNANGYFLQEDVLKRVPNSYYLFAGIYMAIQLLGIFMIHDPRHTEKYIQQEEENRSLLKNADPSVLRNEEAYIRAKKISGLKPSEAYGQTFIADDHYLALVGSISSGFNFAGRLVWGRIHDRFLYKKCLVAISSLLVILISTLIFTPYGGKAMFSLWVWLITFSYAGMYVITPSGVTDTFGEKHGESNYGMVFSSQIINAPIVAIITQNLSQSFGWEGIFVLFTSFSFLDAPQKISQLKCCAWSSLSSFEAEKLTVKRKTAGNKTTA